MSFLNSVLKVFVGDKSKKDVKELQPILDKIKSFEKELEGISSMNFGTKPTLSNLKLRKILANYRLKSKLWKKR